MISIIFYVFVVFNLILKNFQTKTFFNANINKPEKIFRSK